MKDIGAEIRKLREQEGYSQDELAERLFVTRQTVSNYERNQSRPSLEMLEKIAAVFAIDVTFFFTEPTRTETQKRQLIQNIIIWIFSFILYRLVYQFALDQRERFFDTRLLYWVRIFLKPGLSLWLGWIFMCFLNTRTNLRFPRGKNRRYIYSVVGAIIVLYLIIMLPCLFSWKAPEKWIRLAHFILGAIKNQPFSSAYLIVAFLLGSLLYVCKLGAKAPKK